MLGSSQKVALHYGVSTKAYYQFPTAQLSQLKLQFRTWAIEENLHTQKYRYHQHLKEQYLSRTLKGILPSHLTPQARRKVLRGFDLAREDKQNTQRFLDQVKALFTLTTIPNPFITLSSEGVARLFGKQWKGSGQYWIKKLVVAGLLTTTSHELDLGYFPSGTYFLYQELGMSKSYQWREGKLKKVFPNQLLPTPITL
ncbi:hypothetical protein Q5H92_14805 [Hymenobacter sp. M29]|uniref:Transposase n=1 Tax=Hymenobacter mellowenesis TaxID=3063995 RepID=A0ABT9ACS8_9BACT|nr:hypothetical protein [Hymenobacter sp. M29]MDO7847636.1 hypothetical protein [Hymenobacter sp. M29]